VPNVSPDDHNLTAAEMQEAASRHRLAFTFDHAEMSNGPIAKGWYAEKKPQPKLSVMAGRMQPLRDLLHGLTAEPMVYFGLTLEGTVCNRWSQRDISWSSGEFLAASVREPVALQSLHRADETITMTGVMLDRGWMDAIVAASTGSDRQFLCAFLDSHLDMKTGKATLAMQNAARRIIATAHHNGPVNALRIEAAALDFIAAMLAPFTEKFEETQKCLTSANRRRLEQLRDRLDSIAPDEHFTLAGLACEFGYSVSTICRHFRQVYGVSITRYLADCRLRKARRTLAAGEMTISQAAYLAGYSNPASFSTAFRRAFGISPGRIQRR
jgi:AraC-like DNA-binding protein